MIFVSVYGGYVNFFFEEISFYREDQNRIPVLQVLFSAIGLLSAALIAILIEYRVRTSKDRREQTAEILRLSENFFDKDYYAKVIAPSWEIVLKWTNWTGESGHDYRRSVVGGSYLYNDSAAFRKFDGETNANTIEYSNYVRFHPHFLQYDALDSSGKSNIIDELSEHMILTITIKFWCHVAILNEEGIVSERDTIIFFKDFYRHYHNFFRQYVITTEFIIKAKENNAEKIDKIERLALEKLNILDEKIFCFKSEDITSYNQDVRQSAKIADGIWKSHQRVMREKHNVDVTSYNFENLIHEYLA